MLGIRKHNRERALAEALAASLDAVRDGSASVEVCLQRYPDYAAELEPLLQASARLQAVSRLQPSELARLKARFALIQAAAANNRPAPISPRAAVRRRSWLAFAPAAMAALLFAVIAVPVLGSVDSNAVPGDWNYSFKRATERVRLALATDSTDRRLLRLEFAKRRLNEIELLSSHGQVENHAGDVTSLLKDYTADLNQVKNATVAQGQIPSAVQQQIEALTPKAEQILPAIAESSSDKKPDVKNAASAAVDATKQTQTVAASLPTPPSNNRSSSQATPTKTPVTAAVVSPTPAPADTASPTATRAADVTPTPAPATPTATPPAATATPTPQPTATATAQPPAGTPLPLPTRESTALAAVLPTQTPPTRAATPQPTEAPVQGSDLATAAPQPTRSSTPRAGDLAGAATATPASGGSPAAVTAPLRTATPAAIATPAPVATREASVPGSLTVVGRGQDSVSYRWIGPATTLDAIVAQLGSDVVYVSYQLPGQPAVTWFPGSAGPAPLIVNNELITVKLKTLNATPQRRTIEP